MINKNILRFIDTNYYRAINQVTQNLEFTREELLDYQSDKFLRLINHCKNYVPYYKCLKSIDNINSIDDLKKLPFLTKELIKKNFNDLKAANIIAKRFKPNSTSGSTGEAMKFFSDIKTDVVRHACTIRGDSWTGWKFGEPSVIIWGATKDTSKANTLKGRLANSKFLFNKIVLSSFNMTNRDMTKYISKINKFKPTLIIGYPSSLELFANYISRNNFEIISPKGIITGGESLYEPQRETIQNTFRCKVLNRYGCRDVGHIANECQEQNGLHISSDHVIVEVVNEKGEHCKSGELGEIVVTDLDNYVFPFIRYKIGDLGVLSNRVCGCGKKLPILERVEGRTFDLVIGPNGNRAPGNFFTLLRYKVKGVDQFQVRQKIINKIKLKHLENCFYQIFHQYHYI